MNRLEVLASNRFCRVCFTQDENENFHQILDTISQMELLSVGNIEIFDGDGFPDLICNRCKIILSNAYKFKQNCRKSDTQLKMYPMTGVIPPKINIVQESLLEFKSTPPLPENKDFVTVETNTEQEERFDAAVQTDQIEELPTVQMEMIISNQNIQNETAIIAPPTLFEDESDIEQVEIVQTAPKKPENVKILNKATQDTVPAKQFKKPSVKIEKIERIKPKILNSQLQGPKYDEAIIETIEDGNIQFINIYDNEEYLEEELEEEKKEENMDKSEEGVVYTCSVCDRSFPLLQQLEIHKQNHERARDHPCEYCEKAFFTKYDLAKHILTHTKQKDYTCIVCKKSFSRSTLLYRHEKIHNDPKIPRYSCEHCDRVYLNKLDYDKHQTTHSKSRPWACNYCDKRFAFKQGLERHEVVHDTESLPHSCEYCTDRFKTAAMLQRHLSSAHAGTRAFPCSKCSKRFMLSHHLYRHMRTSHQSEDETVILQCPECEQNFNSRDSFMDHCMEHAIDSQVCPMCKYASESIEEITEHIDLHAKSDMYFCDYCATIYMNQEDLNEHLVEKHSNELCAIGEEEIEFIVETPKIEEPPAKRKQKQASPAVPLKKHKQIDNMEGVTFIEYEEVSEPVKPEPKSRPTAVVKESPKPQTARLSRVKMSQSEIDRLKKEGKITIQDGLLVMKP